MEDEVILTTFTFEIFPVLETDRLRLRRITANDADAWLDVWNHPDVMRYLVDFEHTTTDLQEVNEIIQWADRHPLGHQPEAGHDDDRLMRFSSVP